MNLVAVGLESAGSKRHCWLEPKDFFFKWITSFRIGMGRNRKGAAKELTTPSKSRQEWGTTGWGPAIGYTWGIRSSHFPNIWKHRLTSDPSAPIIISPNQLVITPDKGPCYTLSGLIHKVDHDILTNQVDKPQFYPRAPRIPRRSLVLCLVIRRDLEDATLENHRQRPLQDKNS
jgi:hypothetical protein